MRKVKQADELYHQLVLVVAPAGVGRIDALQNIWYDQAVTRMGDES